MPRKPRNPNLVNILVTHEEAVENGKRGAKRSVEVRRARKAWKEEFNIILDMAMKDAPIVDIKTAKSFAKEDLTTINPSVRQAIFATVVVEALKGKPWAVEFIRDQVGETPVQEVHVEHSTVLSDFASAMCPRPSEGEEGGHLDEAP